MQTTKSATAGTLESNDILVTLTALDGADGPDAVRITLESIVLKQFGDAIETTINDCLERAGLRGVHVDAQDKGALECAIRARMETAIARFKEL